MIFNCKGKLKRISWGHFSSFLSTRLWVNNSFFWIILCFVRNLISSRTLLRLLFFALIVRLCWCLHKIPNGWWKIIFGSKNKTWMMRKKITIYTCAIISSREIIRLKSVLLLLYMYMHLTKRSCFWMKWSISTIRRKPFERPIDKYDKSFLCIVFRSYSAVLWIEFCEYPLRSERRRFNLEPATNLEVIWFRFF